MFALVYGGSGSGKSEFAENFIINYAKENNIKKLVYIATMPPYGEEAEKRISKHRKRRISAGFITEEIFCAPKRINLDADCAVLFECVGNAAANEMFLQKSSDTENAVFNWLFELSKKCRCLTAVTNDIFSDGVTYDKTTEEYKKILANINIRSAQTADKVSEIVCGREIKLKG